MKPWKTDDVIMLDRNILRGDGVTAQIHERLILDGEETSMAFCPSLPLGHERCRLPLMLGMAVGLVVWLCLIFIKGLNLATCAIGLGTASLTFHIANDLLRVKANPRIKEQTPEELSTACWRSYLGTWEIRDGMFYLVKLEGQYRLEGEEPLLADWFTGVLRIPQGEVLEYVHMGFASVYEEELHIRIHQGEVVASRVIDNRGKVHDSDKLGWRNLPGGEKRFDGDKWKGC